MAREAMEEKGRGGPMEAEESSEAKTIYLVMPSYAEPFKIDIMQILSKEKRNLCETVKLLKKFLMTLISKLHLQTANTSNG